MTWYLWTWYVCLPALSSAPIFLTALPLLLFLQEMPIMNGFEATKEIRRRERARGDGASQVVIIGLSGNARGVFSEIGASAGMNDYVVSIEEEEEEERRDEKE